MQIIEKVHGFLVFQCTLQKNSLNKQMFTNTIIVTSNLHNLFCIHN